MIKIQSSCLLFSIDITFKITSMYYINSYPISVINVKTNCSFVSLNIACISKRSTVYHIIKSNKVHGQIKVLQQKPTLAEEDIA